MLHQKAAGVESGSKCRVGREAVRVEEVTVALGKRVKERNLSSGVAFTLR